MFQGVYSKTSRVEHSKPNWAAAAGLPEPWKRIEYYVFKHVVRFHLTSFTQNLGIEENIFLRNRSLNVSTED
jgi:hypothetical protein